MSVSKRKLPPSSESVATQPPMESSMPFSQSSSVAAPSPPSESSTPRPEQTPASEIDLILARFRLRARRRTMWLQKLWSEDGEPGGRQAVTHAEMSTILGDKDSPSAEAAWFDAAPEIQEITTALHRVEAAIGQLANSRLHQLADTFGLSADDLDLLEACACVALDPSLARACAYLNDHSDRAGVTDELAARLYGHGRCGIWPAESPLFRWDLVLAKEIGGHGGEPRLLTCDAQVRDWLRGQPMLDEMLVGVARLQVTRAPLPSWPVEETQTWIAHLFKESEGARVRIQVNAPRGAGRRTFAADVAHQLGLPLLVLDSDAIDESAWRRAFIHAQRQAFLDRCALAWTGDSLTRRSWPQGVVNFPLQFALTDTNAELPSAPSLVEQRITLNTPTSEERASLWRQHLPLSKAWRPEELAALAENHRIQPGDIARAAQRQPSRAYDAARAARESARTRLGPLAQLVETPFTWDDLVVPPAVRKSLEAIAFEAENHTRFWEQASARRLFPQGRGLLALLSGPPGVGKTMSAQVIAAHLGQDLFRVNVAQLVSKWVGETAKHFDFLLTQAAEMSAVIFFDEADAPFAKRSSEVRDAQDKFANTDAAFLLQAIESFPGVALLATNLKGNIDPAFFRRLRYLVEFPKPDASLQFALWEKLVGQLVGEESLREIEPALAAISVGIEVTGAQIKYAVLAGIFEAQREKQRFQFRHLLTGLERELAKEGRAIGPREREKLMKHA